MKNVNACLKAKKLIALATIVGTSLVSLSAAAGDHATHYRYNKMGQVIAEIGPKNTYAGGSNYIATRYTYNSKGEITLIENGRLSSIPSVTVAPSNWYSAFSGDTKTVKVYNANGELIREDNQTASSVLTSRTLFSYDGYGRLTCQNQVMNLSSSATNCLGTGSNTSDGYNRISVFEYNDFDQPTKEYRAFYTAQAQVYKEYIYDSNNMLQAVKDANGNRTDYRYDDEGRLEFVYYPHETNVGSSDSTNYERYTYDDNGNMLTFRKRSGVIISYQYDALDRLIKKDMPGTTKDFYYGYDLRGLKLYSVYYSDSPSQQGLSWTYDGFGRVETESHKHLWHAPLVNAYQYDANGNRTRFTYPDGEVIDYTYDEMNRIKTMSLPGVSSNVVYSYNAQGLPASVQRPNGTSSQLTYDNALRIQTASENLTGTSADNTYTFTFNPANQIKSLTVSNQTYGVNHTAQGTPGEYFSNGLNQYTEANGSVIDYDTDGNLILDEAENAVYEYSDENQLTKAIIGGSTTELGYDAAGRLLHVGDTYFLYDGESVIAEYEQQDCYPCGRTMTKRYVHSVGIDNPIAEYNGSGVSQYAMTYLHRNYQGSIIAGSSYNGNLAYNNGYDSFGVPEPTNQGRFGYTGQMYLSEIGLYYYKARIYQPKLGRFLQVDPVGYEDQMNVYTYVHNDPISMTDPSGKVAFKVVKQLIKNKGDIIQTAVDVGGDVLTVISPDSTPMERIESAISLVSPVDVSDVKAAKGMLEATGEVFRGRKGGIDTRAQNQAIADNINDRGGRTTGGFGEKETRFAPEGGGNAGSRYSDGSAVDANGNPFQVQTVDTDAAGEMTKRELDAAIDIATRSGQPVVCVAKTSCQ